jgi:hypothetical protein
MPRGPAAPFASITPTTLSIYPDLGPGQLIRLDEPLDAFIGANTIEITVTGSPSALPRLSGRFDKDWTPPTP